MAIVRGAPSAACRVIDPPTVELLSHTASTLSACRVRRETAEARAESVWQRSNDGKLQPGHCLRRTVSRLRQAKGEEEEKEEG